MVDACRHFGLIIIINKTEIMGQDVTQIPAINIGCHALHVPNEFTFLGSSISYNLSIDNEISKGIGKASGVMAKLS